MYCPQCKVEMNEKIGDYQYRQCGLDNVMLINVPMYECPTCKLEAPRIPNISDVHRRIAEQLIGKESVLDAKEIRFLRKELGLKEVELADYLGVDKVTVSRWETGASKMDASYDRLFRLFFVHKKTGTAPAALSLFKKVIAKETSVRPSEIVIRGESLQRAFA